MPNQIPEKLINYRVYLDATDLLGTADVTLPVLDAMTEKLSGAGLAGEVDSPVLGHFKSMTATIKWRTVTEDHVKLTAPKAHHVEFRGAMQIYDAAQGALTVKPLKVVVKGLTKGSNLGKLSAGKPMDAETKLEVVYLKVFVGEEERLEVDKFNYILRVDGQDYLTGVRQSLGLAG